MIYTENQILCIYNYTLFPKDWNALGVLSVLIWKLSEHWKIGRPLLVIMLPSK